MISSRLSLIYCLRQFQLKLRTQWEMNTQIFYEADCRWAIRVGQVRSLFIIGREWEMMDLSLLGRTFDLSTNTYIQHFHLCYAYFGGLLIISCRILLIDSKTCSSLRKYAILSFLINSFLFFFTILPCVGIIGTSYKLFCGRLMILWKKCRYCLIDLVLGRFGPNPARAV